MNMFVGNLHYSTNSDGLCEVFSRFGEVEEAKVIYTSNAKGHKVSKGYGFVRMASREQARVARQSLDGAYLDSRLLKINDAFYKHEK